MVRTSTVNECSAVWWRSSSSSMFITATVLAIAASSAYEMSTCTSGRARARSMASLSSALTVIASAKFSKGVGASARQPNSTVNKCSEGVPTGHTKESHDFHAPASRERSKFDEGSETVENPESERNSLKDTCPNALPASCTIARTWACALELGV